MNDAFAFLATRLSARLRSALSTPTMIDEATYPSRGGAFGLRSSRRRLLSANVLAGAGIAAVVVAGVALRISAALQSTLAVDEAESSINAFTIFHHGYPTSEYLSMPIYENTLTVPWYGNEEYEFRDSSYSSKGIAVYHAWLPLYSIAAAQALAGMRPDELQETPRVLHDSDSVLSRTLVPRLPAIVAAGVFLLLMCRLAWQMAGPAAAMVALTWAAFSERLVFLGHQARYYSLTLCMTAAVALALWHVARRGRWRDFLLLGATEGLLFHTHQLSSVVLAQLALLSFPLYLQHRAWFAKSLGAVGVAGALTIPWAWFCGFFETASSVPKAYELFTSWTDWLAYPSERPASLLFLLIALAILQWARHSPRWLPRAFCERIRGTFPTATLLIGWLLVAYVTMQFLVPAASYFTQRLTIMLQVPGILLLAIVAGAAVEAVSRRWSIVIAFALTLTGLWASGKLSPFTGFEPKFAEPPVAPALAKRTFAPGTRFYASPNLHLAYTYYSGLPIQSIAPVRRSFLESYPGPIVFIEHRHMPVFPRANEVIWAAERAGKTPREGEIRAWRDAVWSHQVLADVGSRGLQTPPPPPIPAFLEDVLAETRERWKETEANYIRQQRQRPIFRDVTVDQAGDLWMSFFYRFADYPSRIGRHANIHPRLQGAEIELRPESSAVIFYCSPLRTSPHPDTPPWQTSGP